MDIATDKQVTCARCGKPFTKAMLSPETAEALRKYFGVPENLGHPQKPILCSTCKTAPHYCCEEGCGKPAAWIRKTQFAGNHSYCEKHAEKEPDFTGPGEAMWEEIPKHLRAKPKPEVWKWNISLPLLSFTMDVRIEFK